jgi:hypothetical protein
MHCAKICSKDELPLLDHVFGGVYIQAMIDYPTKFPEMNRFRSKGAKGVKGAKTLTVDEMQLMFLFCYHMAIDKVDTNIGETNSERILKDIGSKAINFYGKYNPLTDFI